MEQSAFTAGLLRQAAVAVIPSNPIGRAHQEVHVVALRISERPRAYVLHNVPAPGSRE